MPTAIPGFQLWLDISKQSTGFALTTDQCARIKVDGYSGIVVQLWSGIDTNPYAAETIQNALAAGLLVAGYVALNSDLGNESVMSALIAIGSIKFAQLCFIALDCEIDGITPAVIDSAVAQVVMAKQRPVIYTAYWWWVDRFGNLSRWSGVPLWVANYDGTAAIGDVSWGGWTHPVGKQYTNTQSFAYGGQEFGADVNCFREDFITSAPGTPNGLAVLAQAWKDDMNKLVNGSTALRDQLGGNTNALLFFANTAVDMDHKWSAIIGHQP